jgi:hypothetical protein
MVGLGSAVSVLSLIFSNGQKEARRKKEKDSFPAGRLVAAVPVPAPSMTSLVIYAIKSYFKGWSLNLICTLCVSSNLVG